MNLDAMAPILAGLIGAVVVLAGGEAGMRWMWHIGADKEDDQ